MEWCVRHHTSVRVNSEALYHYMEWCVRQTPHTAMRVNSEVAVGALPLYGVVCETDTTYRNES